MNEEKKNFFSEKYLVKKFGVYANALHVYRPDSSKHDTSVLVLVDQNNKSIAHIRMSKEEFLRTINSLAMTYNENFGEFKYENYNDVNN